MSDQETGSREIHKVDPQSLVELLRVDDDREVWPESELAEVFQHQLRTPLHFDLPELAGPWAERTFGQLLLDPTPPKEVLEQVKQFAKSAGDSQDPQLPKQVSALLYLVAIAVARLRLDDRITSADDRTVAKKWQWAIDQTWLDEPTRTILQDALQKIVAGER